MGCHVLGMLAMYFMEPVIVLPSSRTLEVPLEICETLPDLQRLDLG